jgi:hypothetical protein
VRIPLHQFHQQLLAAQTDIEAAFTIGQVIGVQRATCCSLLLALMFVSSGIHFERAGA